MRLLIIGPQGAGKGTQATLLAEAVGVPHVSTGDLFRANIAGGTELGKLAQRYTDAGALVPDEVTQDMVIDRFAQADAADGFLLDGFPRNLAQANWLDNALAEQGYKIDKVVLLTAPDEVLTERMTARGRSDDTPEAIRTRLDLYHRETTPLIDHYSDRVVHVDGVGEIEEVQRRIREALGAQPAGKD
jgi:adenylate kinase